MPTKAEMYAQMADHVATQLTGSWQEWAGFLATAARLYKYPFHEQMMIYAQRPDATACAEYDLWNEKMGRYVRRGSKGNRLGGRFRGPAPPCAMCSIFPIPEPVNIPARPWLWETGRTAHGFRNGKLERNYGIAGNDLPPAAYRCGWETGRRILGRASAGLPLYR